VGAGAHAGCGPDFQFVVDAPNVLNFSHDVGRQRFERLRWHLSCKQHEAVERNDAQMRLIVALVRGIDVDLGFGLDALVGHLLSKGPFAGIFLDRPRAGTGHD